MPELNPDLVADVQDLKQIPDNHFDGGMADPPYHSSLVDKLATYPVSQRSFLFYLFLDMVNRHDKDGLDCKTHGIFQNHRQNNYGKSHPSKDRLHHMRYNPYIQSFIL